MQDPFFGPIPALQTFIQPISDSLSLRSLPLHIHEILGAFLLYQAIFEVIAPPLSDWLLPQQYRKLSWEGKLRWNMHCTSMVQSVTICVLALFTIFADEERRNMNLDERMWGYTGAGGLVQALATGYFLFDLIIMLRYTRIFGVGMLVHASSCLLTYTLGFRPICNYYSSVFMLYELSTPFLNIHWFFDKLGMTGTKAQLYNGLTLLCVFFSCRLVWGAYSTFNIYRDIWDALHLDRTVKWENTSETMRFGQDRELPMWLVVLGLGGHFILQVLNVWWFSKMIAAVKKRFVKTEKKA